MRSVATGDGGEELLLGRRRGRPGVHDDVVEGVRVAMQGAQPPRGHAAVTMPATAKRRSEREKKRVKCNGDGVEVETYLAD